MASHCSASAPRRKCETTEREIRKRAAPVLLMTMARDFNSRQAAGKGSGLLLGLFIGFLLGLGVAAAIAVYVFKTPTPFTNKSAAPAKSGDKPGALPETASKAGKGEEVKPRFDFYRILPGQEEPV